MVWFLRKKKRSLTDEEKQKLRDLEYHEYFQQVMNQLKESLEVKSQKLSAESKTCCDDHLKLLEEK